MAVSAAYEATRAFRQECFTASRALRRLPKDVKAATRTRVTEDVARPLAAKISSAASGPYAAVLAPAVKVKADLTPVIRIGGARKVVSGKASVRQLLYGTEWGGGKRVANVNRQSRSNRPGKRRGRVSAAERAAQAAAGRTIYKRNTTMQFRTPHPFIYPTIESNREATFAAYGRLLDEVLQGVISGG